MDYCLLLGIYPLLGVSVNGESTAAISFWGAGGKFNNNQRNFSGEESHFCALLIDLKCQGGWYSCRTLGRIWRSYFLQGKALETSGRWYGPWPY